MMGIDSGFVDLGPKEGLYPLPLITTDFPVDIADVYREKEKQRDTDTGVHSASVEHEMSFTKKLFLVNEFSDFFSVNVCFKFLFGVCCL